MQDQPTRLCECGCGDPAPIAKQTTKLYGHVKGQPVRFIAGHQWRRSGPRYEVRDCGYETPCWPWLRSTNAQGYGLGSMTNGTRLAHRIEWESRHGPIPEGLELDHLCRNPRCVNPDHLEAVTHTENMRRSKVTTLTLEQARAIRNSDEDALAAAARYGISRSMIYNIRQGRSWREEAA